MCSGGLVVEDEAAVRVGFKKQMEVVEEGSRRGGWPARHGASIRWASLLAWMFGHVHRAMCSGGCQFEVLEEHVRARYVPAYKTRQMRQARKALEPESVGGASENVGGRRRALENVDEGRCCWPSALVQVPDQPWPSALIQVPNHPWLSALK